MGNGETRALAGRGLDRRALGAGYELGLCSGRRERASRRGLLRGISKPGSWRLREEAAPRPPHPSHSGEGGAAAQLPSVLCQPPASVVSQSGPGGWPRPGPGGRSGAWQRLTWEQQAVCPPWALGLCAGLACCGSVLPSEDRGRERSAGRLGSSAPCGPGELCHLSRGDPAHLVFPSPSGASGLLVAAHTPASRPFSFGGLRALCRLEGGPGGTCPMGFIWGLFASEQESERRGGER